MIHPAEGRILINKIEVKEAQTDGGIVMPGQSLTEESLFYGEVLSDHNKQYPKGTRVFYSRYSATKVFDVEQKNQYYIVSEVDIMAYEAN